MILKYFKEITKIPRCSGNTEKMKQFLIKFAKNCNYKVKVDLYGNILATSPSPKICFQAHYDMVCIGDYQNIEIIQKENYLMAKNSTLGADNGIGIALMMKLMKKNKNLEFLFTNDEEIGLIGASNLQLKPKAKQLINLDSEDENIYIGCAGGFDVKIKVNTKKRPYFGEVYQIEIDGLLGGHSGIDIDKNTPNAIKELVYKIKNNWKLLSIKGGERRNSIPMNGKALIISNTKLNYPKITTKGKTIENSSTLIKLLKALPNGILGYDKKFNVVTKSANLAIVNDETIILSFRANSNEELKKMKTQIQSFLEFIDVKYQIEDEYPAWEPIQTKLAETYQKISKKKLKVIHAGLEPAILGKFFDEMISIGPNIYEPHSIRERVKIKSIYQIENEINTFLKEIE